MEAEYRWYEGDLVSVEKNRKFLTDDEAIKAKIPSHLKESSLWGGHLGLSREAQDQLIIEFILAFEKNFGGHFVTGNVEKIRVCMDSSAGKPWKSEGIAKKRQFYQRKEHEMWLCQYIHYAHCFNWRENFSAAPKGELTEKEDITEKKSRVFYVAGVMNDYYASDLCKDFNAAIKRMAWNSVGEVWQYGGFVKFGQEMDRVVQENENYFIEESDCSKYDLTCVPFFFRLIVTMRKYFSESNGYENLGLRLEQLYHQALEKDLIWFDGSVFKTGRGNPSGWKNTTEDNCIRHLFIRWYHFTKTMKQDPDYFWTKVFLRVYSDDSVCIADRSLIGEHDLNASYTFWNTVYKGYVKPLTRDISDTTYLGARFKKGLRGITYTIARQKAFWSVCVNNHKLSPLERKNRCEVLASLLANEPEVLEEFLVFCDALGVKINVEKAKFIAGGLLGTCTDFSHVGFSSGCVNYCREAPSSGLKLVTAKSCLGQAHTLLPLSSYFDCLMGVKNEKKAVKKAAAKEARKVAKEKLQNMQIVATRNKAARDVLLNAKVTKYKPRINWYLIELLDPSRWEEAIAHGLRGIPDFYSHRGHIFCTRTVLDLDATNFDADGKCNILVQPALNKHVARSVDTTARIAFFYSRIDTVGLGLGYYTQRNATGTGTYTPIDYFGQDAAIAAGANRTLYCMSQLPMAEAAGDDGAYDASLLPEGPAVTRVGNYGDYTYKMTAAANNAIRLDFTLKNPFPSGVTGNVTLTVETDVSTTSTNLAAVAAHSSGSFSHLVDAAATRLISVKLVNNTSATMTLKDAVVIASLNKPSSYANLLYSDAQNFDRIKEDFTSYRPVCGYLWLKYRGDLTKNGSLAGALIDSAATPTLSGTADYGALAGLLHAHEGSVTQGGYGIWTPMNPADTNFSPIDAERPDAPFLMAALDVNDTAAQAIRLEAYFVWEGLTQLQMYAPEPGSVDIEMMNDAFAKLAHFRKFMENDTHLKTISNFLSGAMRKGGEFYTRAMGDPVGRSAIREAARLLMSKAQEYGPTIANAAKIALAAAGTL